MEQGRGDKALESFRKATKHNPRDVDVSSVTQAVNLGTNSVSFVPVCHLSRLGLK